MNPLQSGTPSSSLAPQGYKNSTQSGTVQGTLNSSNVQQSNDDLLRAPATGKLQVSTGNSGALVLGATTQSTTSINETKNSSGVPIPVALLLLVASAVACVYFYRKYVRLAPIDIEQEDQTE